MIALTWQTMLLLVIAYFVGCIVGCFLRKLVSPRAATGARTAIVPASSARVAERRRPFVASPPTVAPIQHAAPVPLRSIKDAFRRANYDTPSDAEAALKAEAPSPSSAASARMRTSAPTAPSVPVTPPLSAVDAVTAAATAAAAAAEDEMAAPVGPPPGSAPAPPPAAETEPDDLTRIRAIDRSLAAQLNELGVVRYADIAEWTGENVRSFSEQLGLRGRIERENWIEQAHILARGGETSYARGLVPQKAVVGALPMAATELPTTEPDVASRAAFAEPRREELPPRPVAPAGASAPDLSGMRSVRSEVYRGADSLASSSSTTPDDLKRIRGIGLLLERRLNAMGVLTYEQIANWTADDVAAVNHKLEFSGRIERENWIEQARILASGGHTDFSRRFERGEV